MATKLAIEERIRLVKLHAKFENSEEVRRQWKNFYSTDPPSANTIRDIVRKFDETGSVYDRERSGRPRTVVTEEAVQEVEEMLVEFPQTSVSEGALRMDMSESSYYRAVKETNFRPYRPHKVIALSDDDFDRREEFCAKFLDMLAQNPGLLDMVMWSDESNFKLNGVINRHNCCYWAPANPNVEFPVAEKAPGITVWIGLTSKGIIGPFFFEETVTGARYLAMLKEKVWPHLKHRGMYFQQDGASPHYAIPVRAWLDEKLPGRWIGRRGPIEWPARSPDLAPCDFFLWGYLKNIVYRETPASIDELRDRITQACTEIPKAMCATVCRSVAERFDRCRSEGGKWQL